MNRVPFKWADSTEQREYAPEVIIRGNGLCWVEVGSDGVGESKRSEVDAANLLQ